MVIPARFYLHGSRLALVALALLLGAACTSDDEPTFTPSTPTPTPEVQRSTAALVMNEGGERSRLARSLDEAGYEIVEADGEAELAFGDRSFGDARGITLDAWVAVTDQRRDVLELTREEVAGVLTGEVTDWAQLGGTELPVSLHLANEDVERIELAFGLTDLAGRGDITLLARADLGEAVAGEPGAFALMAAPDLRPGILALVVDGHDPLRDAERESPLRLDRWVRAAGDGQTVEALRIAGWTPRSLDFEPVAVLATGEILPVRCTYAALQRLGDYGAMFDGTRHLLQAADIVVSQLDAALTDRVPPSPCVSSFDLRAPTAIAAAIAEAGVDVISTGTNHHMDCGGGACTPTEAHLDTVGAIEDAGMLNFGSGENLEAARQPAIIERGGVRFAFLGYDAIGRDWYGASPTTAGTAPLGWDTLDSLAEDVSRAKEQADHVIVAFSWGYTEYVTNPDDLQRTAARVIAEAGGSLIVGNGPHIVQASEMIGDLFVAYSLGNFIYDQDWSIPPGAAEARNYETVDNVIMESGFTRDRMIGYRMRPAVIRETHRPDLVDPAGEEGQRILQRLWGATDALPPWED